MPALERREALPDGLDPRGSIGELASRGFSGELEFAGGGERVVVFFQAGRIAWANDSLHRRAFVEHLRHTAGVDQGDVEAVVEECRKTRRPIGETLVEWNLASPEQVRAALRHQIALALEVAARCGGAPSAERHSYRGTHDPRFTFEAHELAAIPGLGAAPCPVVPIRPAAQESTADDRNGAAPGADRRTEVAPMTATEKLKELQGVDGFSGAALFTPTGEQLAILEGDAPRLKEVGILANAVLINAQKASLEMGAGRGQLVHVEGERAQVLVRCLNEGTDPLKSLPGKAHIHLVLVLKNEASIGLAKLRIDGVIQRLAEHFRG